jgi:hypothetical protein
VKLVVGWGLLFGLALSAAEVPTPVYVTAGAVRCGAVRRGADQVQIWCWTGLVFSTATSQGNAIFPVPLEGTTVDTQKFLSGDTIEWTFTRSAISIAYTVTGNGSPVKAGSL